MPSGGADLVAGATDRVLRDAAQDRKHASDEARALVVAEMRAGPQPPTDPASPSCDWMNGFKLGDMVFGKVTSHPWWPGHIYNDAFANPSVRRARRDGHVLVAFFGDSSYRWFSPSNLIPYEPHFAEKSRQTGTKPFAKAFEESLDETGRRGELAVTCSCRNPQYFRPAGVPGYFCIDMPGYEPDGIYSYDQIQRLREGFMTGDFLSFVRDLAVTVGVAPLRKTDGRSASWIRGEKMALAYRRAVFKDFDETYAQALGVESVRPSKDNTITDHTTASMQQENFAPRVKPLEGKLVVPESLAAGDGGETESPLCPGKEEKYLAERREEPHTAEGGPPYLEIHDAHHLHGESIPPADGDRPVERPEEKYVLWNGEAEPPTDMQVDDSPHVALSPSTIVEPKDSLDAAMEEEASMEQIGLDAAMEEEASMEQLESMPLSKLIKRKIFGGGAAEAQKKKRKKKIKESLTCGHEVGETKAKSCVFPEEETYLLKPREEPHPAAGGPPPTELPDVHQLHGESTPPSAGDNPVDLPDVKYIPPKGEAEPKTDMQVDDSVNVALPPTPSIMVETEDSLKAVPKQEAPMERLESMPLAKPLKRKKEDSDGDAAETEKKRRKKKMKESGAGLPTASGPTDGPSSFKKPAEKTGMGKPAEASSSAAAAAAAALPAKNPASRDILLTRFLDDLTSLAVDSFYGVEFSVPSIVRRAFLRYRSMVYVKSLVRLPSSVASSSGGDQASKPSTVKSLAGRASEPSKRKAMIIECKPEKAPSDRKEIPIIKKESKPEKLIIKPSQAEERKSHEPHGVAEAAVSAVKPDNAEEEEETVVGRVPSPAWVVMSFPQGSTLPSASSLKAKFGRFGPLDLEGTRISWKNFSCRVLFKYKTDAVSAVDTVKNSDLFGQMKVSYSVREVVAVTEPAVGIVREVVVPPVESQNKSTPTQVESQNKSTPAQPSVQLKSILKKKKPSVAENGGGSVGKEIPRVKFMLESVVAANKGPLTVPNPPSEAPPASNKYMKSVSFGQSARAMDTRPAEPPVESKAGGALLQMNMRTEKTRAEAGAGTGAGGVLPDISMRPKAEAAAAGVLPHMNMRPAPGSGPRPKAEPGAGSVLPDMNMRPAPGSGPRPRPKAEAGAGSVLPDMNMRSRAEAGAAGMLPHMNMKPAPRPRAEAGAGGVLPETKMRSRAETGAADVLPAPGARPRAEPGAGSSLPHMNKRPRSEDGAAGVLPHTNTRPRVEAGAGVVRPDMNMRTRVEAGAGDVLPYTNMRPASGSRPRGGGVLPHTNMRPAGEVRPVAGAGAGAGTEVRRLEKRDVRRMEGDELKRQMLGLMIRCNDVLVNVKDVLGYLPYRPF